MPVILITILALAPPAELPPPPSVDLAGWYDFAPDGGDVAGVVSVQADKSGPGLFVMQWHVPGASPIVGVGMRDNGYLWASWRNASSFGLVRYRIERDKNGNAKLVADRGSGEVLTWLRK